MAPAGRAGGKAERKHLECEYDRQQHTCLLARNKGEPRNPSIRTSTATGTTMPIVLPLARASPALPGSAGRGSAPTSSPSAPSLKWAQEHGEGSEAESDRDRDRRLSLERGRKQLGGRDCCDDTRGKVLDMGSDSWTRSPQGGYYRADQRDAGWDQREGESACERRWHASGLVRVRVL